MKRLRKGFRLAFVWIALKSIDKWIWNHFGSVLKGDSFSFDGYFTCKCVPGNRESRLGICILATIHFTFTKLYRSANIHSRACFVFLYSSSTCDRILFNAIFEWIALIGYKCYHIYMLSIAFVFCYLFGCFERFIVSFVWK